MQLLYPVPPDVPCEKCGCEYNTTTVCHSTILTLSDKSFMCFPDKTAPEHFHKICQNCEYEWISEKP